MPVGLVRLVLLSGITAAALSLVACGSSTPNAANPTSTGPAAPAPVSASTDPASTDPAASASVSASSASAAPTSAISIPPYLCDATDKAQNAADAYMGALSAGNEKQAAACVLPNTVPASTTHGLLASQSGTAVYLPRDGVDGPAVFGYSGNAKSIDVTVTKEPDGRFWITKVVVGDG